MADVMMPDRIKRLAVYGKLVVPWFVVWTDGVPDHRIADAAKLREARRMRLCWICGEPLGSWEAFVVGPMCVVNGVSGEPPQHRDCALYAAQVCPFLTQPARPRRETDLPEDAALHPTALTRNPGCMAVVISHNRAAFRREVFVMGKPYAKVVWFHQGQLATRAQVEAALDAGCPTVREAAEKEGGAEAVKMLDAMIEGARAWLPREEIRA